MGGYGSGRRSGRSTTDYHRVLDVRRLQRDGLLTPGRSFGLSWLREGEAVASIQIQTQADRVILDYRHKSSGGDWASTNYPILLEWTACTLGGRRAWFLCPAKGCGRRVAILYSGAIFACRHCYKLTYESQREKDDDRAMRRADTIRQRLGWGAGIANPPGNKPKGMHWRTFNHLTHHYHAFARASWEGMAERFGLLSRR